MPKTWKNNRRDIRDLNSRIRKGTVVYTVREVATNIAPYEDGRLYSSHEFTWRSPVTGNWMTGHMSAAGLLAQEGTIWDAPPRGMRDIAGPGPQVGAPLGHEEYSAQLDEAEIRGLGKRVRNGSDPHTRPGRGERGRRR